MMLDRDQRRSIQVPRQYLEQHVHHGFVRLVEDRVVDVTRFEEKFPGAIHDSLVRQHVGHVAGRYLANSGADVVVFAHVPARRERQFRDPKLVFSVEVGEKSGERRLELDPGDQAPGVDLHRTAGRLRGSFARPRKQCNERQACEAV